MRKAVKLIPSSPMFDTVEVIREHSLVEAREQASLAVILGKIKQQAEAIITRGILAPNAVQIQNVFDAEAIVTLVNMAEALELQRQLTESLKGRK